MIRQTSIEAYNKIKEDGTLGKTRWEVYNILFHHAPMTQGEIKDYLLKHGENPLRAQNAHCRLTELRHLGVAQEVGKRKCSATGQSVILWDVTANLPNKIAKKQNVSKKKMLEDAIEVISFYAKEKYGDTLFGCGCDNGKRAKQFIEDWGIYEKNKT